jgi:hypothetical protein
MPDTRLILHVKGTQSETTELPKEAIRSGLSQGKITYSQLIWSTADNAWKQAREWPELMPGEPLILHVKGTEADTRQVPKRELRSAIAQGEITHSQLIWSASENAWKQVREMPELLPSQKLAPVPPRAPIPAPSVATTAPQNTAVPVPAAHSTKPQIRAPVALTGSPKPRIAGQEGAASQPKVAAAGTPKVAGAAPRVAASAGSAPKVATAGPRVAAAGSPSVRTHATSSQSSRPIKVKEEDDHFHPVKWLCIVMGGIVTVLLLANAFLVALPLSSKFDRTPYSKISVFGHFGAFMQPNVLVIHIPTTSLITSDNLADVIAALARSSPADPLSGETFDRVAITSGWTAQYSFSGSSWKALAQLDQESPAQRKEVLLAQMDDASGQPILAASTLDEAALQVKREAIWKTFVSHFAASP